MKPTNELTTFVTPIYGALPGDLKNYPQIIMDDPIMDDPIMTPPFRPTFPPEPGKGSLTKEIQIINAESGEALVNAHVTSNGKGGVTDQYGLITVSANSTNQIFNISYVGFRTHKAAFKDLGSMISLQVQTNSLPPVVVNPKPPITVDPVQAKANKTLLYGLIGAGLIFALSAMASKKPKKKRKAIAV